MDVREPVIGFRERAGLSLALLPLVLILAAVLRFQHLADRGLLYWDEGKFVLEGIRLRALLGASGSLHSAVLSGKAVGTAKPMHALFIGGAYTLFGVHDYAALFMNAAASTLQVLLLYILARRLFGARIALLAALFLAISEYDIVYARSALSESDANLFLTAGALVGLFAWRRASPSGWTPSGASWLPRLGGGVLLGLGCTVNYRLIIYVAVLVAVDLAALVLKGRWRTALGAGLAWGSGILILPLMWEGIGLLAQSHGYVLFRSEITDRPQTYFSEVLYQLHGGKQAQVRFDPGIYLQWYAARETVPMLALIMVGLVLAILRRSFAWLMPAAMIVGPYLVYVFAPFIVPRNLAATLPFAALLAAATLAVIVDGIRSRALSLAVLILIAAALTVLGGSLSWRLGGVRSGFARATQYLHGHGARRAVVANEIMLFYLRRGDRECRSPVLRTHTSTLVAARAAGIHYAVVDVYDTPAKRFLLYHGYRVARFLAVGTMNLGENPMASDNGWPPGLHLDQHVDVYRLIGLRLPPTTARVDLSCSLDRVA